MDRRYSFRPDSGLARQGKVEWSLPEHCAFWNNGGVFDGKVGRSALTAEQLIEIVGVTITKRPMYELGKIPCVDG